MELLLQHVQQGEVYRRSDLEYFSTAIDRHLAQLTKMGALVKLNQGLYFSPLQTKFGYLPPDENLLIGRFLKDENFLIFSPNKYNALGLGLTQLYNTTWVYNHKRNGEFIFNGRSFLFKNKSAFPNKLSKEFLLIDLLNNIEELAEDQAEVVEKIEKRITNFNLNTLMKMTQLYGSGKAKGIIKCAVKKINFKDARLHK